MKHKMIGEYVLKEIKLKEQDQFHYSLFFVYRLVENLTWAWKWGILES